LQLENKKTTAAACLLAIDLQLKNKQTRALASLPTCNWFTTGGGIKLHRGNPVKPRWNLYSARPAA
jgi:hypothetical protein